MRAIACFLGFIAAALVSSIGAHAQEPAIWFAPQDPLPRGHAHISGSSDFMGLFSPEDSWSSVSAHVHVFKIATQFVAEASDPDLRKVFAFLNAHRMGLAVEILPQTGGGRCGNGVEGYGSGAAGAMSMAMKIKRLGGTLNYVAMDEPLWFGHEYRGAQACRSAIAAVAQDVAHTIQGYRSVFPDVEAGDIEPLTSFAPENVSAEFREWLDDYRAASGKSLAFLHLDLDWSAPWRVPVHEMVTLLASAHVPSGIIYDGDPTAATDTEWLSEAEQHFDAVESEDGMRPDNAVFQSWMPHPTHVLPPTSPGAFTYLLRRYLRPLTTLTVSRTGDQIIGHLTGGPDEIVPGADIAIEAQGRALLGLNAQSALQSSVPPTATAALIGLRVHAEGSGSDEVRADLGAATYREMQSGTRSAEREIAGANCEPELSPAVNGQRQLCTIVVAAAQKIVWNSSPFPVTPNAVFRLDLVTNTKSNGDGGYIAVIFLNREDKEIARFKLPFRREFVPIATARSDNTGNFAISLPASYDAKDWSLRAVYRGSDRYREAVTVLP